MFGFLLIFLIFGLTSFFMGKRNQKQDKICFQAFCFEVEIARTAEQRRQGLMFRKSLDENKGMLFDFGKQGRHSFWMKNTLIPLDIIWFDDEHRVAFIKENAQPCVQELCQPISPSELASYVLEINAGMVDKIGLSIGATMIFDIEK